MNDYGFDYMNYITNIPSNINYNQQQTNFSQNQKKYNTIPNPKTLDPNQGWLKGNLFANLYEPYKNYKPMPIEPKNEQEALLFQIMQYKFALIELNLYLDNHPNDIEMINLFNQYQNIEKQICDKYESMYEPLTLNSNYLNKNTWTWNNSPWPWEVM